MKKVTIDLVKGAEGYSLAIVGKDSGYRYQGPKAWGNPYNKPTASFEVNLKDFIKCLKKYAYDEEKEDISSNNVITAFMNYLEGGKK